MQSLLEAFIEATKSLLKSFQKQPAEVIDLTPHIKALNAQIFTGHPLGPPPAMPPGHELTFTTTAAMPYATRVAAAVIREAAKYSNLRETHGKNRSPEIDKINLKQKSYLGAPYCLAGCQQVLDDVRANYGCIINLPEGAGTQSWWRSVRDHFRTHLPQPGMIGILRSRKDPAYGHAFIVVGDIDSAGWFQTFEFNTNSQGSRDGEGAMFSKRHINGSPSMELLGFVDVAKAASPA